MSLTAKQVQLVAYRQALKAQRAYSIDREIPVDILSVLREAGIVVMQQPLGTLGGAYIPRSAANTAPPGIILNSNHPWSRQRYTAAHEFCHHLRDRDAEFDTYSTSEWAAKGQQTDRERIAEAFASWFLMPPALVDKAMQKVNPPGRMTAENIFALSQFLGTSYAATVMHLFTLGRITAAELAVLRKVKPSELKRGLGARLARTPWNDVWVLNLDYDGAHLQMRVGDEVQVIVPETPSTGFEWIGGRDAVNTSLELSNGELIGGSALRRFTYELRDPGRLVIALQEVQPWDSETFGGRLSITIAVSKRIGVDELTLAK